MKWYSVKEHTPILTTCCVLLAVRNKQSDDIFLCLGEWNDGWRHWNATDPVEEIHLEVMYFCYPDPIPKAYENMIDNK